MTEARAIEGCRRNDRISQKYLFDKWSEGMLMVCMRYVKHLPDAEELMLAGFFSFFKTIDRFIYSNEAGMAAWLKKIMVNECLMHLRKKGALKIVEIEHAEELATDESGLAKMSAGELFKLVMTLPEGYRTVFNLHIVEGYSHKEISALLGISEGTSKSQLSKARVQMQTLLKQKENYYEK